MKKILSIFSVLVILTLCLISCDINSSRPLAKTVTIEVRDVFDKNITAVALFCNLNEWKASEVMAKSDIFIADVVGGTATFTLQNYTYATTLKFQFTPMKKRDDSLGDDWWSFALSGSASYSNYENNLVVNFAQLGKTENVKVVLSKSTFTSTGAAFDPLPIYGIRSCRRFNEGFRKCFVVDPEEN